MANTKTKAIAVAIPVGAVLVVGIALVVSSLQSLDTYEIGLKYDTIWKKLENEPYNEGLYTGPPGFEFIVFSSVFSTITYSSLWCLNKDGVGITLDVSYQYRIRPNSVYDIAIQFRDEDGYKTVLNSAGEAAIYEACSLFNTTQLQAERGIFQESVGQTILDRYNELHADVSEIQVNNIARPGEYEEAVRAKETARENINVVLNERPKLLTQANTTKKQAEAQAQITINKANSDSRIILNRAETTAEAIIDQYDKETEVYETLLDPNGLNLTVESFLSYIAVRAVANAKNPVYVGIDSPAKTSYMNP